jgi:hypothetical protein
MFDKNEVISLIKLIGNSYLDNLCDKPGCHFVVRATLISKDVTTVDIPFYKCRVTWYFKPHTLQCRI